MSQIVVPSFLPFTGNATLSIPVSATSAWITAIDAPPNGVATADPINPTTGAIQNANLITDTKKFTIRRSIGSASGAFGTTLRVRLVYPPSVTGATQLLVAPQIRVFGGPALDRTGMVSLRNLAGDRSVRLALSPDEDSFVTVTIGTQPASMKATTPDNIAHSWDCDGCEYLVIGVEKAFSYQGGPGTPVVQVKFI